MRFKQILIVGLILTIFTIGAVSASDELISEDNLAVDSSVEDSIIEIDDSNENNNVIAEDSEDIIGNDQGDDELSYDEDYVECYVYDVDLSQEYDNEIVYFRSYDNNAVGTLKVYVNNNRVPSYQETIDSDDYDYDYEDDEYFLYSYIYPDDLGITKSGDYTITVYLNNNILVSQSVHVSEYSFYVYAENEEYGGSETDFEYGDTIIFNVVLPDDASGRLTLNVNGRTYDVNYRNGIGKLSLSTAGWNLGRYTVTANYAGNYRYSPESRSETIYVNPKVSFPNDISVGENEFITFSAPSGFNGNMVIIGYKWDYYEDEYVQIAVQNVPIVNGYGRYSLAYLPAHDDYKFNVNYQVGSYSDDINCYFEVKQNSPGFSSSVTPTTFIAGNNVNVQVLGARSNSMVTITVDNTVKRISLINGQVNEVLSGLTVGTHKIKIYFDDGYNYYSNTVYVTVKPVPAKTPASTPAKTTLTLKKIKVKKSAKKLVLQATLKKGKSPLKNKKIIFKFNGKSYKAKTNAKGIAKFTIKKSVLKKLKVGKKIKYQASFGKIIVKKTLKVKK